MSIVDVYGSYFSSSVRAPNLYGNNGRTDRSDAPRDGVDTVTLNSELADLSAETTYFRNQVIGGALVVADAALLGWTAFTIANDLTVVGVADDWLIPLQLAARQAVKSLATRFAKRVAVRYAVAGSMVLATACAKGEFDGRTLQGPFDPPDPETFPKLPGSKDAWIGFLAARREGDTAETEVTFATQYSTPDVSFIVYSQPGYLSPDIPSDWKGGVYFAGELDGVSPWSEPVEFTTPAGEVGLQEVYLRQFTLDGGSFDVFIRHQPAVTGGYSINAAPRTDEPPAPESFTLVGTADPSEETPYVRYTLNRSALGMALGDAPFFLQVTGATGDGTLESSALVTDFYRGSPRPNWIGAGMDGISQPNPTIPESGPVVLVPQSSVSPTGAFVTIENAEPVQNANIYRLRVELFVPDAFDDDGNPIEDENDPRHWTEQETLENTEYRFVVSDLVPGKRYRAQMQTAWRYKFRELQGEVDAINDVNIPANPAYMPIDRNNLDIPLGIREISWVIYRPTVPSTGFTEYYEDNGLSGSFDFHVYRPGIDAAPTQPNPSVYHDVQVGLDENGKIPDTGPEILALPVIPVPENANGQVVVSGCTEPGDESAPCRAAIKLDVTTGETIVGGRITLQGDLQRAPTLEGGTPGIPTVYTQWTGGVFGALHITVAPGEADE